MQSAAKQEGIDLFKTTLITAAALASFSTIAMAGTCPANAPEGYKWLSGYVDEFRANGTVSNWFTESLAQHPQDFALLGLQAFFDAGGDVDAARQLYIERGGSADSFSTAMAFAKIE